MLCDLFLGKLRRFSIDIYDTYVLINKAVRTGHSALRCRFCKTQREEKERMRNMIAEHGRGWPVCVGECSKGKTIERPSRESYQE